MGSDETQQWGLRLGAVLTTILLAALGFMLVPAGIAAAAPQRGIGHETRPAQPYLNNPDPSDWIGSYIVNGRQVFCVQFAFLAPDSDEQYQPGEPLKTKWGTELPADVAADISYLLLRYAATTSPDEAAALAFLLHSWTAAPQTPEQLLPSNDFRHIAYDAPFHLTKLPASAQQAIERLRADAAANRGPWTTTVAPPATPQIIGTPAQWRVTVRNAAGRGVASVPVTITVTDGVLADGRPTGTVPTPADGADLMVAVTPTGPNPTVQISLASPADRPVVQQAIQVDTQRIVSTGGEKQLTTNAATTARTAPGVVKVTKINEKTGTAIAGVSLRLTGSDRTTPALDQQDKPLVGADGQPVVLVTGPDGTATVENLRTPQEICIIEVAPPPGFDDGFDPAAPPAACGAVAAGATLALTVANKPNAPPVPVEVPAGDQPQAVAFGTVSQVTGPGAVFVLWGLVTIVAGLGGFFVRRRFIGRR